MGPAMTPVTWPRLRRRARIGRAPAHAPRPPRRGEVLGSAWALSPALPSLPPVFNGPSSADSWTHEHLTLLLVIFLGAVLVALLARRARLSLPREGLLPALLAVTQAALVLTAIGALLFLLGGLAPARLAGLLPWVFIAAAVALGWSLRDLIPDLIGRALLLAEHRVRVGRYLRVGEHQGEVVRLALRTTWLRDGEGRLISLPNRLLLRSVIVFNVDEGTDAEVTLNVETRAPAHIVRRALRDAARSSPWVRPDAALVIAQDPVEPMRWTVRARLLERRFAVGFRGDLLARTHEHLRSDASAGVALTRPSTRPIAGAVYGAASPYAVEDPDDAGQRGAEKRIREQNLRRGGSAPVATPYPPDERLEDGPPEAPEAAEAPER